MRRNSFAIIFYFILFLSILSCSNQQKNSKASDIKRNIKSFTKTIPKGSIPFEIENNRVIVKVLINDSIPCNLLFDNGWGENEGKLSLSSSFVKNNIGKVSLVSNDKMKVEIRLPEVGMNVYSDLSNDTLILSKGTLKEKIIGFEIYNDSLLLSDPNYDGIINLMDLQTVKENILEINFDKRYLNIINRDEFKSNKYYQKTTLKTLGNNSSLVINIPLNLLGCKNDTIDLSGDYLFDTGNPNAIIIKPRRKKFKTFLNYFKLRCSFNRHDYYFMSKKSNLFYVYKFNNYSIFNKEAFIGRNVLIYSTNFFPSDRYLYDGILPINVIRNFNYFFDLQNNLLYTKSIFKKAKNIEPIIWSFQVYKLKYIVRLVKRNSKIDSSGISCGDTILSINKLPLSYYNLDSLTHLIFQQDSIIIRYQKENKILTSIIHIN